YLRQYLTRSLSFSGPNMIDTDGSSEKFCLAEMTCVLSKSGQAWPGITRIIRRNRLLRTKFYTLLPKTLRGLRESASGSIRILCRPGTFDTVNNYPAVFSTG